MATLAGRYIVKNGNEPNPGNITEEKESEMEEFVEYARIIMGVLGHKTFEPVIQKEEIKNAPIFNFKSSKLKATATVTAEGFILLKGSQISLKLHNIAKRNVIKARTQYKDKISENGILLDDIPFSSPSFAASFVGGASLSGNECWITSDGKSSKDLNI